MKDFIIITDLRKLQPLFKAGILKSYSQFKYVDNGPRCSFDLFSFGGLVYELKYQSGCFYPFVYLFTGEIVSQDATSVIINYPSDFAKGLFYKKTVQKVD